MSEREPASAADAAGDDDLQLDDGFIDDPEDTAPPDDAGEDADRGDEPQGDGAEPEPPPPPRRGQPGQVPRLRATVDKLNQRIAELERARAAPQQPQPPTQQQIEEADRQFYASIMELSPIEQTQRVEARNRALFANALARQQADFADRMDRQTFQAATRNSSLHRRYAEQVEQIVPQLRARGDFQTTREDVMDQLLGRDVRLRAEQAAPRQQRAARTRVAGQNVPASSGRGDGAGRGGQRPADDSVEAARRRIAGQPLW